MKIQGLDELSKQLEELAKNVEKLDGEHSIPLNELLTREFIAKHTRFADAEGMFDASGFNITTTEDLEAVPDDKWDEYIRSISSFSDWQSMIGEAAKEWTVKEAGALGAQLA